MRLRHRYINITKVRPGQSFQCFGQPYMRADDDEIPRHPARIRWPSGKSYADEGLVLAYLQDSARGKRVPVAFQPSVNVVVQRRT